MRSTKSSNTFAENDQLQIDKVYRRWDAENTEYSSDIAGGVRYVPVSLPRVKWLENDPDCPYTLAEEVNKPVEPPKPVVPPGVIIKRRQAKARSVRTPAPKWTEEEQKLLIELHKKKVPEGEIAIKCGRSRKAIMQRLRLIAAEEKSKGNKRRV